MLHIAINGPVSSTSSCSRRSARAILVPLPELMQYRRFNQPDRKPRLGLLQMEMLKFGKFTALALAMAVAVGCSCKGGDDSGEGCGRYRS
ncbi:hypothetical protein SSTU70S_03326 [Stutzerimonas stutzeri]